MRAIALLLLLALDPAFVKATVESIGTMISKEYFDPKVGAEVDATLRRSLADGRYAGADNDQVLALLVNRDLYAATHDKHLNVAARRAGGARALGGAGRRITRPDRAAHERGRAAHRGPAGQRRLSRADELLP